jgi:predicted Zn-dependent protease
MALILAFFLMAASAEELYQRGVMALKQNDVAGARAALEEAAKLAPNEPMMWLAVAEARLRSGEAAQAGQAMNVAARLAPSDPVIQRGRELFNRRLLTQAQELLNGRREKAAEAALREAVKAFPKVAEAHRLLGLALYAQGRNEAAIDSFLTAIDLAPEEEALYAGLETLLPNEARRQAVEARLRRYTGAHAGSPLGWYLLGLATGSEREWEKALELDPNFWPAAFALHKRAEPERAIVLLELVIGRNPEYAPAFYALAQLYAKRGDRERALAARKRHHELTVAGK